MKELHVLLNRLLYPYYFLERIIAKHIINKHLNNVCVFITKSIYIEDTYPFWLRQYDDYNKENYYDSRIRPKIQISYTPIKESLNLRSIIELEILKYKLRHFNFYFDYIKVE